MPTRTERGLVAAAVLLSACSQSSSSGKATGRDGAGPVARAVDAGAPSLAIDAGAVAPDDKRFRRALRRGRELAHAGDAAGAVVAFQEALVARPDDARAMSELSWAALVAGDLALAKRSAQRAAELATDPQIKAAALYNCGRVSEEHGDIAGALDSYQQSLALRPSRIVEQRVRQLSSQTWSEAPLPLAGPFADAAAFCASLGLDADDSDDAWCIPEAVPVTQARRLPPPIEAMAIIRHAEAPADTSRDLALRTATGWWVLTDFGEEGPWIETEIQRVDIAGTRVVIRAQTWEGRIESYRSHHLTVCGVGGSGAPSCLGPLLVRESEVAGGRDAADGEEQVELDYEVTLRTGDILSVVAKIRDPEHDISGEHSLTFP